MTPYQKAAILVLRFIGFFSISYSAIILVIFASQGFWLFSSPNLLLFTLFPLLGGLLLYYAAPQIARLLTRDFGD